MIIIVLSGNFILSRIETTWIPFGVFYKTRLKDYTKRRLNFYAAKEVLPELNDLAPYKAIVYKYRNENLFIATIESMLFVVKYDKKTYEQEKNKLDERKYLEPMRLHSGNEVGYNTISNTNYSINSFNFRMLELDKYIKSMSYIPKEVAFIATSDEKNEIAYLYYYCYDCDGLDEQDPIGTFIKSYFKYNW